MHISEFQCGNYKSLNSPEPIKLEESINIITGQNNAGKTALLEALALNFKGNPHRSEKTLPTLWRQPNPVSWAQFSLTMAPKEALELMRAPAISNWYVAVPDHTTQMHHATGGREQRILDTIFAQKTLSFRLRWESNINGSAQWALHAFPSTGLYSSAAARGNLYSFIIMRVHPDGTYAAAGQTHADWTNDLGVPIANLFRNRIYKFSAERFNMGTCPYGN